MTEEMTLRYAVIYGTLDDVKEALKKEKADTPGTKKQHYNTPIHLAAYNCFTDKLEVLLNSLSREQQIKVLNQPNLYGFTPFMEPFYPKEFRGQYEEHHTREETEKYCSDYERRYNNMENTVQLMLERGANPNHPSRGKLYGDSEPKTGQHPLSLDELIELRIDSTHKFETEKVQSCKNKIQAKRKEITQEILKRKALQK